MSIKASLVKELRERTGAGMMECKKALVATDGDIDQAADNLRKNGQAKADKKAGRVTAEGVIVAAVDSQGRRAALVEVNCETDFVAKEPAFKTFAEAVAQCVLESATTDLEAVSALVLAEGGSVEEQRRELIATLGENMSVRRAALVGEGEARIGSYIHGTRIGAVVALAGGSDELARDLAMHVAASKPLALDEASIPAEALEKEREILLAQVADSGKPEDIQEKMVQGRMGKFLKEVTLTGQSFIKDPDISVGKLVAKHDARIVGFVRFEVGEGIEKKEANFAEEVMNQVRDSKGEVDQPSA